VAKALAEQTFDVKKAQEKVYQTATSDSKNIFKSVLEATEEKPWQAKNAPETLILKIKNSGSGPSSSPPSLSPLS
jgi:hypothetical protein